MPFACPYCRHEGMPIVRRRVSAAGWIFILITLLICFPIFWVGFFMREEQRSCAACGIKFD